MLKKPGNREIWGQRDLNVEMARKVDPANSSRLLSCRRYIEAPSSILTCKLIAICIGFGKAVKIAFP